MSYRVLVSFFCCWYISFRPYVEFIFMRLITLFLSFYSGSPVSLSLLCIWIVFLCIGFMTPFLSILSSLCFSFSKVSCLRRARVFRPFRLVRFHFVYSISLSYPYRIILYLFLRGIMILKTILLPTDLSKIWFWYYDPFLFVRVLRTFDPQIIPAFSRGFSPFRTTWFSILMLVHIGISAYVFLI